MTEATDGVVIELLAAKHDRASFSCGQAALDRYLGEQARQDVERNLAAVFIARAAHRGAEVLGYYTLTASEIRLADVPAALRKRVPYPRVPATLLGRVAVSETHARRGLGTFMLMHAATRALAPETPASWAMIVDPIDGAASAWYQRFGFQAFLEQPDRLFIPLATLRAAFGR